MGKLRTARTTVVQVDTRTALDEIDGSSVLMLCEHFVTDADEDGTMSFANAGCGV